MKGTETEFEADKQCSAVLISQFRCVLGQLPENGQDSIRVKDTWLKYKYVDSSFYKESMLINIKSI